MFVKVVELQKFKWNSRCEKKGKVSNYRGFSSLNELPSPTEYRGAYISWKNEKIYIKFKVIAAKRKIILEKQKSDFPFEFQRFFRVFGSEIVCDFSDFFSSACQCLNWITATVRKSDIYEKIPPQFAYISFDITTPPYLTRWCQA